MRTVRIAAIVSLSGEGAGDSSTAPRKSSSSQVSGISSGTSYAHFDVLGQSLLDREISKLERFGVARRTVIAEASSTRFLPSRNATAEDSVETWDRVVAQQFAEGVDHLLLLRTSAYTDL